MEEKVIILALTALISINISPVSGWKQVLSEWICLAGQSLPAPDDLQRSLCEAAGVWEADRTVTPPPTFPEESLQLRPVLPLPVHQKEDPSIRELPDRDAGGLRCFVFLRLLLCSHSLEWTNWHVGADTDYVMLNVEGPFGQMRDFSPVCKAAVSTPALCLHQQSLQSLPNAIWLKNNKTIFVFLYTWHPSLCYCSLIVCVFGGGGR